jgi:hypothetical protein
MKEGTMELEQALARIGELEGRVAALSGERDALTGRTSELEAAQAALDARLAEATGAQAAISAELAEARSALGAAHDREMTNLRRALLAEHADQIVPELVVGDDEPALLASLEASRQAYARAWEAARTTIANQAVPAGAPSARTAPAGGLSPLEMIESGLRK